jgi:hypothetical protein
MTDYFLNASGGCSGTVVSRSRFKAIGSGVDLVVSASCNRVTGCIHA